jgi:hypothetical protein
MQAMAAEIVRATRPLSEKEVTAKPLTLSICPGAARTPNFLSPETQLIDTSAHRVLGIKTPLQAERGQPWAVLQDPRRRSRSM